MSVFLVIHELLLYIGTHGSNFPISFDMMPALLHVIVLRQFNYDEYFPSCEQMPITRLNVNSITYWQDSIVIIPVRFT